MSDKSNNNGRAYEFTMLFVLQALILKHRKCEIEKNSSYYASEKAWKSIDKDLQISLFSSAVAGAKAIFEAEPLILEHGEDYLTLKIQSDQKGRDGDVRDVLIIRHGIEWEIGLSLKHNHFAVKHSRLAKNLDFGEKWFGIKCSQTYWNDVAPIFNYLDSEKIKAMKWRDLPSKENDVYRPLLQAFIAEVQKSNYAHGQTIPKKWLNIYLGSLTFIK